jgi:altronate dehydratase
MKANAILINPKDNVVIALDDIKKGDTIVLSGDRVFTAISDIPFSHKVAIQDIKSGSSIIKYGEIIGEAKGDLKAGEWVHINNIIIDEE